jgi:arylsulfatase A-like enzyme
VAWEKTLGELLTGGGYACAAYGKWHVGEGQGRWPTDRGSLEWYGPPRTYDEALWPTDPWYDPQRDPVTHMLESRRGDTDVTEGEQLTLEVRRDCDSEYLRRAQAFIRHSVGDDTPFFVYFNHSLLHLPVLPRPEFRGRSGRGDWADSLLELDADFGTLLDLLDELGVADDTLVVFAGDNGPEDVLLWRGTPGYWEGSYFAGGEGNLRTPCLVRWPGHIPPEASATRSCTSPTGSPPCCAPPGSRRRPTGSSTASTSSAGSPATPTAPSARATSTGWAPRCTGSSGTTSSWCWSPSGACKTRPLGSPPRG